MNHHREWRDMERTAKDHLRGLIKTHGVSIVEYLNYEGTGYQADITILSERVLLYLVRESKPDKKEETMRCYCNCEEVLEVNIK